MYDMHVGPLCIFKCGQWNRYLSVILLYVIDVSGACALQSYRSSECWLFLAWLSRRHSPSPDNHGYVYDSTYVVFYVFLDA